MRPWQLRMAIEDAMLENLPDTPPVLSMTLEQIEVLRSAINEVLTAAAEGRLPVKVKPPSSTSRTYGMFG